MKEFFDFLLFRSNYPIDRTERMMAYLGWISVIGFFSILVLMIIAIFIL